jgi:mono/diheme cytochrome c family protein
MAYHGVPPLLSAQHRSRATESCAEFFIQALGICASTVALLLGAISHGQAVEGTSTAGPNTTKLEFNRDIRPILSETCFQCHGPDKNKRQADLRLDLAEGATKDLGGHSAIVPGKPDESALIARIISADADERMPPPDSDLKLSAQQIALLRQWIEQGAEYQPHWSFIPAKRPSLPQVKRTDWGANPIDRFVLARLEGQGLQPSSPADKTALLRRVTFDLTGLPPTPAEIDAFLGDESDGAYDRVVDRLLASPRYGERMAVQWLDAARYADTNGYQTDGPRFMWRWRDWVIDAFNHNQPFDQFTIEQVAGDMLPDARLDQIIATGFNRNHRGNAEGGIIPAEFLVEYAVDRVETTTTVWLGLTAGCARCHDHKFDPITQKDFYRFFALFNNIPEMGKVLRDTNSPPLVKAPTPPMQARLDELNSQLAAAEAECRKMDQRLATQQVDWEKTLAGGKEIHWNVSHGLEVHFEFDGNLNQAIGPKDATSKVEGGEAAYVAGEVGQAADFDGQRLIDAGDVANLLDSDAFSFGAWIYPRELRGMGVLSRMDEDQSYIGYDLYLDRGKVQVDISGRLLDDAIRVETVAPLPINEWHHVLVTYDGSKFAKGVRIFVDGKPAKTKILMDTLSNPIKTTEPLRIGSRGTGDRFRGAIDDVRFFKRVLTAQEIESLACTDSITEIAATAADKRTSSQQNKIHLHYMQEQAPTDSREVYNRRDELLRDRNEFEATIPTVMVMQELTTPKDTFVLIRGEYDKPGEKVTAGVPASLPALPAGTPANRLTVARWLVAPENPLTARVTVNRFWQMYFGIGLVKTAEDFGSQGEWPTHPELLDWLATEFIRLGWDVKALQKTIVTSATYRQSSKVTPALLAKDPENRLLARGPRVRLPAEMVRDQALAVSGLLVEKIGGPSVKPYQPAGLWEEVAASGSGYKQDHGPDLYRRSLYTFWKRTVAPPSMMTFDSAAREMCVVRQARTNTPLQALTLMNDITYVEAARALGQRMIREGGASPEGRISFAFRLATARLPRADELKVLRAGYERRLAEYRANIDAAKELIAVGESKPDPSLDPSELAACTVLASLILNLDEVITKE